MNTVKQTTSREIHPKILYYGMPVFLLSTLNEDDTTNISPMSASWALGNYVIIGVGAGGKALENLRRHPECVINLPDPALWNKVEQLAPYTGKRDVPDFKSKIGFRYEKDKFKVSGFTPLKGKSVSPNRLQECPIQMEAEVKQIRIPEYSNLFAIVETEVIHVHAHENIINGDHHIDPSRWSPLFYNFRHYFGLGKELGKTFRAET